MADLQVDLPAVERATAALIARRVDDLEPDRALHAVAAAVPGGELAGTAQDEARAWAAHVDELCRRVAEHAARARAACEALLEVDRELTR